MGSDIEQLNNHSLQTASQENAPAKFHAIQTKNDTENILLTGKKLAIIFGAMQVFSRFRVQLLNEFIKASYPFC
jgi:hypothetical protein